MRTYSFREVNELSNRLLNFLRKKGVAQSEVLLTQMSLQHINWLAISLPLRAAFG